MAPSSPSPLRATRTIEDFVSDGAVHEGFEKAGPRAEIAFDPRKLRAGIVTCGGLCPGINDAIRTTFLTLHHTYGVRDVIGFRYGLEGITPLGTEALRLSAVWARDVHRVGGSALGSSRGRQDTKIIVDTLERLAIGALFAVGGNGTIRAARDIHNEVTRRGGTIAVVVPKTIDDDIGWIDKTFGFDTAVAHARDAIDAAHAEARGARNGVGIVKLMGRDAGFIAASATLASGEANFCLIPEFPFPLHGERGLLQAIRDRLARRGHAVIVVAEGCGIALAHGDAERDASGNLRYASPDLDIGTRLRDEVVAYLGASSIPATVKYIDPSYTIRASPANGSDAVYCAELGRHAVHAAMAGRSGILVGRVHGTFVHVPLDVVADADRRVDRELWLSIRETTGQPVP